jgi:hypothetical protein
VINSKTLVAGVDELASIAYIVSKTRDALAGHVGNDWIPGALVPTSVERAIAVIYNPGRSSVAARIRFVSNVVRVNRMTIPLSVTYLHRSVVGAFFSPGQISALINDPRGGRTAY